MGTGGFCITGEGYAKQLESGDISYNYAFSLLDIKVKNYDVLKEDIIRYE